MAIVNGANYDHSDIQSVVGGDTVRHMYQDTAGRSMLAPTEASSTASAAHTPGTDSEYFVHNNKIYQATSPIAQGGTIVTSGSGANCKEAPVGASLSELKSAITPISPGWHYGYKTNTGTTGGQSGTDRKYSDFILCPAGSEVKYVAETNHSTIAGISFYDIDGNFLSGISDAGTIGEEQTATAPANAWYCVLSTKTNILEKSYAKITNSVVETVKKITAFQKVIKYISPNGNDNNSGLASAPYKTLNKAITAGADVVYAEPGTYEQPSVATLNNKDGFEFFVLYAAPDVSTKHKPKAIFENAYTLSVSADSETGLLIGSHTFSNTSNWYKVFVSQTLPISPSGMQSETYNAILWECDSNNETNDKKLKPVLTIAECQAQTGTFYYDHTAGHVYINPDTAITNPTFMYLRFESGTMVYISNSQNVKFEGLEIKHAPDYSMQNVSCKDVELKECRFTHTAYRNGLMVTKGNTTLTACEALQMTGDGFGIATQGCANLIDCDSHHNGDDGVSHHDGSVGFISGGHYHHNGKGGISSPYSGAKVNVYNAMMHNNVYGLYVGIGNDECIISGCALVDNDTAIINGGYTLHCFNNVFSGNTHGITGNGNTVVYGP